MCGSLKLTTDNKHNGVLALFAING